MTKFYTVWAKKAGNYRDVTDEGHIWMYYDYDEPVEENRIKEYRDENNERIFPRAGDTVYTNSFTVSFAEADANTLSLIGTRDGERCVGTFRNDTNPYTGLTGGYFVGGSYNGSKSISGNCVSGNDAARLFYICGSNTTLYSITLTADTIEVGNNYLIQSNASSNGGRRSLYVTSQSIVFNGNGCLAGDFYQFGVVSINSPIIRLHGSGGLLHATAASTSTTAITGNITSDDDASAYVFYYTFGAFRTTINGSIDFSNSHCVLQNGAITNTQNAWSLVITGNVKTSNNTFIIQNTTSTLTFQGDVTAKWVLTGNVGSVVILGELKQYGSRTIGSATSTIRIVGDIYLYGTSRICNTCSIQMTLEGDKLYFEDAPTPLGVLYGAFSVSDNWRVINGSTLNPLVTLSRMEFENTDQYPAESNVKKDVTYAFGQKVGTLEPVTVDSRNTINVYPYAKRVI